MNLFMLMENKLKDEHMYYFRPPLPPPKSLLKRKGDTLERRRRKGRYQSISIMFIAI